jgi:hypothetical protein
MFSVYNTTSGQSMLPISKSLTNLYLETQISPTSTACYEYFHFSTLQFEEQTTSNNIHYILLHNALHVHIFPSKFTADLYH